MTFEEWWELEVNESGKGWFVYGGQWSSKEAVERERSDFDRNRNKRRKVAYRIFHYTTTREEEG